MDENEWMRKLKQEGFSGLRVCPMGPALNDWFYSASWHACRAILRFRSAWLLAIGGLCGEVLLFGGLALLIRAALQGL